MEEPDVISIPNQYSKKISRVEMDSNGVNAKYGKLISFFKTELKGKETFIDFANMPMLYFFTQKQTPSSFYQNPMTLHNDFLQTNFIENLGHYQTPFLLFGKVNEDFFDNVDGVPNTFTSL